MLKLSFLEGKGNKLTENDLFPCSLVVRPNLTALPYCRSRAHPGLGYRKFTAILRDGHGETIDPKRVTRLRRRDGLPASRKQETQEDQAPGEGDSCEVDSAAKKIFGQLNPQPEIMKNMSNNIPRRSRGSLRDVRGELDLWISAH